MKQQHLIRATAACVIVLAAGTLFYLGHAARIDRGPADDNGSQKFGAPIAREPQQDAAVDTAAALKPSNPNASRRGAYQSALRTLIPIAGEATAVIDKLTPAANSGDMDAALAIYLKVNSCRLQVESWRESQGREYPQDCAGLAPEDYTDGGKWLETAAAAGQIDAQFLYANSADSVLGPPREWLRDPERLMQYKRKAMAYMATHAQSGSIDAMDALSNAYANGILTKRDPVRALAYFEAASLGGAPPAGHIREELEKGLSPSEVYRAQQEARKIYEECCVRRP